MLIKESIWLASAVQNLDLQPDCNILNFGSKNKTALKYQPYIEQNLFIPLKANKLKIINFDLSPGAGVNIYGDIFDDSTFYSLKDKSISAIFLFNVLEHVEDIRGICNRLESLIAPGGYILISVPYKYPRHFDPIDNMFRPTPLEIKELFTNCEEVRSEIIKDFNYSYYLKTNKLIALKFLFRLITPFYKFNVWRNTIITKLKYLNVDFEISCLVLKKIYSSDIRG